MVRIVPGQIHLEIVITVCADSQFQACLVLVDARLVGIFNNYGATVTKDAHLVVAAPCATVTLGLPDAGLEQSVGVCYVEAGNQFTLTCRRHGLSICRCSSGYK